jgi:hypothetical protein
MKYSIFNLEVSLSLKMLTLLEFLKTDDYSVVDKYFIATEKQMFINNNSLFTDMSKYVIIVLDGNMPIEIEHLKKEKYYRANFYVLKHEDVESIVDGEKINTRLLRKINIGMHSTNQKIISGNNVTQLLLENTSDDAEGIVADYKKAVGSLLSDSDFCHEMLRVNLDCPSYGIKNDTLYVINEDDTYIRRMLKYHNNCLTFYYFGEDLQTFKTHILVRFVRFNEGKLVAELDFDMNGIAQCDNSSKVLIPLSECTIQLNEVREVVTMFDRTYSYLD